MKRLLPCLLAAICLCITFSTPVLAGKILTVAINPNFPPMEMKDKKGIVSGYEIDLMKAMGQEAGFQVKFVEVPWKDIFGGLDKNKYDAVLASVSITDGRKEKYDFSEPYFTSEQIFVVPKAKLGEPLRGKNIAAFKLTTGAEALRLYQKVNICYYTVEEVETAFKDLSKGFIEGVLCDSPVALDYAVNNKSYKDKFATTFGLMPQGVHIPKEHYAMVVRKGNAETLELLNRGLKAVREKGIEDTIRSKWMLNTDLIARAGSLEREKPLVNSPKPTLELNTNPGLSAQGNISLDGAAEQKVPLELNVSPVSPVQGEILLGKPEGQKATP